MESLKQLLTIHSYTKARLRWDIKGLERRLVSLMTDISSEPRLCLEVLEQLMVAYQRLYAKTSLPAQEVPRPPSMMLRDFPLILQARAQTLRSEYHGEKKSLALAAYWQCLLDIRYCLNQEAFGQSNRPFSYHTSMFAPDHNIERWFLWLSDLIRLHRNSPRWTHSFCQTLSNDELKTIALSFHSLQYSSIVNSLFYYKIHPETLLDTLPAAEQLLRMKHQLCDLHTHIEDLFHAIAQRSWEQLSLKIADYLYHGDELPYGIHVQPLQTHKLIIEKALEVYPSSIDTQAAPVLDNPVQDILRAYKFWFNPTRLIDAIINLSIPSLSDKETSEEDSFIHQIQALSTSECLDFYGYLSNKDTQYFLRSLHMGSLDRSLPTLPNRSAEERAAIAALYEKVRQLITYVRETLDNRNITLDAYPDIEGNVDSFDPGKRNQKAIQHIITHYVSPVRRRQSSVDDLLCEMEADK